MKKRDIILKDKQKALFLQPPLRVDASIFSNFMHVQIEEVILELDRKKNEALESTWKRVNKDFGSIFCNS
jgi:hypothetical protein